MSGSRIAVVLAAGKGTRMGSAKPKVLHRVAGKPLLHWVIASARQAGCDQIHVVVGHGADEVMKAFAEQDLRWVVQERQLGTGHALARAASGCPSGAQIAVLSGDVPLVSPSTIGGLFSAAEASWGALAVSRLEQPGSLGRVTAVAGTNHLAEIIEARDATAEQLEIRLINAGLYVLPSAIFGYLETLDANNAQGELYLTDAVVAAARNHPVELLELPDSSEALGVNDRQDLAKIEQIFARRSRLQAMQAGVSLIDPQRVLIGPEVEFVGSDSTLFPGVSLIGSTVVGDSCTIHQGAWIRDSRIGNDVEILPYSVIDGAHIESGCSVGPFARLRPGSHLQPGSKVGNFVETKNTVLGPGSKASHLTYLGDAELGADVNVGAGVVTCNYDGANKHRTVVGDGAFIGSDTMLVAPVEVGRAATTGAGSVITSDVPDDALAVGRARQRTIPDWSSRRASKSPKS